MAMYETLETSGVPIKAWVRGVPFDPGARDQLYNTAKLPIVYKHVAVMPDVHFGLGATIGSVVPTRNAVIPAAVGVDIGCGMMAVKTSLNASHLPDNLKKIRSIIEATVPHGYSRKRDVGAWGDPPDKVELAWSGLVDRFNDICDKTPAIRNTNNLKHLGTLGGGNHFIEICLDEAEDVWIMLHSGSRGVGNRIGRYFIEQAKRDMESHIKNLPHKDLAYLKEGTVHFDNYIEAVSWAQDFARTNRQVMMDNIVRALRKSKEVPKFTLVEEAVNCHHNYVEKEEHFGEKVLITRKGAVRARKGDLGIIPGSMGARSFIVRGLGNPESFHSCSHGAGRVMSRAEAKRRFRLQDHAKATEGVECRKDKGVIDETPMAYKPIDAVMNAQKDLVEILYTLRQVVCVKG